MLSRGSCVGEQPHLISHLIERMDVQLIRMGMRAQIRGQRRRRLRLSDWGSFLLFYPPICPGDKIIKNNWIITKWHATNVRTKSWYLFYYSITLLYMKILLSLTDHCVFEGSGPCVFSRPWVCYCSGLFYGSVDALTTQYEAYYKPY